MNSAGWGIWEFDLSDLPANASITRAQIKMQLLSDADNNFFGLLRDSVPIGFYASVGEGEVTFTGTEHLNRENFSGSIDLIGVEADTVVEMQINTDGLSFLNTLIADRSEPELFYRLNALNLLSGTYASFASLETPGDDITPFTLDLTIVPEPVTLSIFAPILLFIRRVARVECSMSSK